MPNELSDSFEEKKRIALENFNLLIDLINEYIFLQYQLLKNAESSEKEKFEKDINHALALLTAAQQNIKKEGPSPLTDYLMNSALTHIANHLPKQSIDNIVKQLNDFNNLPTPEKQEATKNNSYTNLIKSVSPIFSSQKSWQAKNHYVIDFAADQLPFKEYGRKMAGRLGAGLIQVNPNHFSAVNEKFFISKDGSTAITLIGHCRGGLNYLTDNSGREIPAAKIAEQLAAKMLQTNTPLDTEFHIDLIACQAASGHPPFAEILVNELFIRGITRVKVSASPTIMLVTDDGRQANLTHEEDARASRPKQTTLKSFSIFSKPVPIAMNVSKVTFEANHNGHVIRR